MYGVRKKTSLRTAIKQKKQVNTCAFLRGNFRTSDSRSSTVNRLNASTVYRKPQRYTRPRTTPSLITVHFDQLSQLRFGQIMSVRFGPAYMYSPTLSTARMLKSKQQTPVWLTTAESRVQNLK
ncbi:hypothetical protein SLA2020_191280 [Shorea laevis]